MNGYTFDKNQLRNMTLINIKAADGTDEAKVMAFVMTAEMWDKEDDKAEQERQAAEAARDNDWLDMPIGVSNGEIITRGDVIMNDISF